MRRGRHKDPVPAAFFYLAMVMEGESVWIINSIKIISPF